LTACVYNTLDSDSVGPNSLSLRIRQCIYMQPEPVTACIQRQGTVMKIT